MGGFSLLGEGLQSKALLEAIRRKNLFLFGIFSEGGGAMSETKCLRIFSACVSTFFRRGEGLPDSKDDEEIVLLWLGHFSSRIWED